MFYRTDNPINDWDNYCAEQEREMERYPTCSECGEPILDDTCFCIDRELICESCMNSNYIVFTSDYMER